MSSINRQKTDRGFVYAARYRTLEPAETGWWKETQKVRRFASREEAAAAIAYAEALHRYRQELLDQAEHVRAWVSAVPDRAGARERFTGALDRLEEIAMHGPR